MKRILLFVCCLIMTVTLSVCVLADNGPEATACYQVNENQIVIEFSEKIKVEDNASSAKREAIVYQYQRID